MQKPYQGGNSPMTFDPNKCGKEQPRWASYIPSRRGAAFRTYVNIGHAKNSIRYRGILYEFKDGKWIEHFRIDPDDPQHREPYECWECGYKGDDTSSYDYNLQRKWVFAPRGQGPFWKRLVLCDHCSTFIR